MIEEINVAVEHISSLLALCSVNDKENFSKYLSTNLGERYEQCWYVGDSERGSASRVLLWHNHGGGEGLDEGLERACLACSPVKSHGKTVLDVLPLPFTMWIDPGCVAIRMGAGPGTVLPYTLFSSSSPERQGLSMDRLGTVKVIWGTLPRAQPAVDLAMMGSNVPHHQSIQPPMLTLSPSTPSVDTTAPWSAPPGPSRAPPLLSESSKADKAPKSYGFLGHARSPSTASSICSSSISRSSSLASSAYTSEEGDYNGSHCPSLMAPSSSSSSFADQDDTDSEISVEDMIGNGCYGTFDIIDYDEVSTPLDIPNETDEVGDTTIRPSDDYDNTLTFRDLPLPGHLADSTLSQSFRDAWNRKDGNEWGQPHQSTPMKKQSDPCKSKAKPSCNYTTHDGGNVGVLGGGVRLGGKGVSSVGEKQGRPFQPQHQQSSPPPTFQQQQSSYQGGKEQRLASRENQNHDFASQSAPPESVGFSQGMDQRYAPPATSQPAPLLLQQQQQQHFRDAQVYSPYYQGHPAITQQSHYDFGYGQPVYAPSGGMEQHKYGQIPLPIVPHPQGLPHGLLQPFYNYDGQLVFMPRTKRVRSRGRRSRGRGAGRAARRQAAALKALIEAEEADGVSSSPGTHTCTTPSTLDGDAYDDEEEEEEDQEDEKIYSRPPKDGGALGLTLDHSNAASPSVATPVSSSRSAFVKDSSMEATPTRNGFVPKSTKKEEVGQDQKIMSLVRQRADEVAQDLIRRHMEDEKKKVDDRAARVAKAKATFQAQAAETLKCQQQNEQHRILPSPMAQTPLWDGLQPYSYAAAIGASH